MTADADGDSDVFQDHLRLGKAPRQRREVSELRGKDEGVE
jgi:hypothetical protein